MSLLTLPLEPRGAIILVGFGVSGPRQDAMHKAGLTVPHVVMTRALVDTGASCTCVDHAVIKKLSLSPSGTAQILTPSTGGVPHECNQFDVAVAVGMDSQIHVHSMIIPVIESDLTAMANIQALIGRDVLDRGILIYDGCHRSLTLAF